MLRSAQVASKAWQRKGSFCARIYLMFPGRPAIARRSMICAPFSVSTLWIRYCTTGAASLNEYSLRDVSFILQKQFSWNVVTKPLF